MRILCAVILLTFAANLSAQNKVVVVPLGSDISAEQFNDLVNKVNSQRVYSDVISSSGVTQNPGRFDESTRLSQGIYRILVVPSGIKNFGDPSIIVTSYTGNYVPHVVNVSLELIDDDILFVEFDVVFRTISGTLVDSEFSYHLQFADEK